MVWSCYDVIPSTHYEKKKAISAINATLTSLTSLTHQITKSPHHPHITSITKASKLPYMDSCLKVYRYIINTYFSASIVNFIVKKLAILLKNFILRNYLLY